MGHVTPSTLLQKGEPTKATHSFHCWAWVSKYSMVVDAACGHRISVFVDRGPRNNLFFLVGNSVCIAAVHCRILMKAKHATTGFVLRWFSWNCVVHVFVLACFPAASQKQALYCGNFCYHSQLAILYYHHLRNNHRETAYRDEVAK